MGTYIHVCVHAHSLYVGVYMKTHIHICLCPGHILEQKQPDRAQALNLSGGDRSFQWNTNLLEPWEAKPSQLEHTVANKEQSA